MDYLVIIMYRGGVVILLSDCTSRYVSLIWYIFSIFIFISINQTLESKHKAIYN